MPIWCVSLWIYAFIILKAIHCICALIYTVVEWCYEQTMRLKYVWEEIQLERKLNFVPTNDIINIHFINAWGIEWKSKIVGDN